MKSGLLKRKNISSHGICGCPACVVNQTNPNRQLTVRESGGRVIMLITYSYYSATHWKIWIITSAGLHWCCKTKCSVIHLPAWSVFVFCVRIHEGEAKLHKPAESNRLMLATCVLKNDFFLGWMTTRLPILRESTGAGCLWRVVQR